MIVFFNSTETAALIHDLNNKNIEVKIINGLNHFLRVGSDDWKKTKEYHNLYEIDPQALNEIITWTLKI